MPSLPVTDISRRPARRAANDSSSAAPPESPATQRLHMAYDIFIRVVLALFFAFSGGVYFKNSLARMAAADWAHPDIGLVVDALSILAIGSYTFLIACLYALRLRPRNKFAGVIPTGVALVGGFLSMGLLYMQPSIDLPPWVQLLGDCLILIGNAYAVYALVNLGRSFSIIPEARKLVTTGPYAFVRHPLYLAEAIAMIGAMINFICPPAMALVAAQLTLQLGRIHYEEKVLREAFPEYAEYEKRTWRLFPGIY